MSENTEAIGTDSEAQHIEESSGSTRQPTRPNERTDLTTGPILKKMFIFALPIIAGNVVMQLYNVADSIIVGQFVGSDALASVTASMPIMMLFNSLFTGFSMGANILIAQFRGASDYDAVERSVNSTFALCLTMGTLITILGILFSQPLLHLLGTPDNILSTSAAYLRVVYIGTIGNLLYMLCNGLARGMGDSQWPFYALCTSAVLNVLLDILFVVVLGWSVPGVAAATALSHIIAGSMMIYRFTKGKYGFNLTFAGLLKPDMNIIKSIVMLGLPSVIQNGATSMGMMVTQSFANSFGSNWIAANGIIQRVDGFAMMPMMGLGMSVTTFVAQNTGANQPERAKKGTLQVVTIMCIIGVIMGFVMYNSGYLLMRAFTSNERVLEMGNNGIRIIAFFYTFMGINQAMSGAVRGAGEARVPAAIAIMSSLIRLPLAYFLAIVPMNNEINAAISAGTYATYELAKAAGIGMDNYTGLTRSMSYSMVISAATIFLYFVFGKWQNRGLVDKANRKQAS